jgi:type IV pilus assembly protein PilV
MTSIKRNQTGTSLIEVMIAIIVLSVGLLAYVGLHAESLQFNKMAQYRSVATQLATDYINRVQANSLAAINGNYDILGGYAPQAGQMAVPGCADPLDCTEQEVAAIDRVLWGNNAVLALPGASINMTRDVVVGGPAAGPGLGGTQPFDVWVMWQDPDDGANNEIGGDCPPAAAIPAGVRCLHYRFAI